MQELRAKIEARVNTGLRGQWYAVAKSVQVKANAPFGTQALSEHIVLWRKKDGTLQAIEDYCPHRGARLSRGEVHEDNVACRYHGVVVSGEGVILDVPAMPACALEGKKAVKSYPVCEVADAVFVYFALGNETPPPLNTPPELTASDWASFLCTSPWATNYRYALDNLADPMHGCYLHAQSFTLAFGSKVDTMKIENHADGFTISRVEQVGANFDWTQMVFGTATWCRLDIPYPPAAGPGSDMRIMGTVTPVDERNCKVFFWRMRQVEGLARESWRFMYRALLEPRHWKVLEQDREMLSAMPDDARQREMLYQHDIGISKLRQHLYGEAKKQVSDA